MAPRKRPEHRGTSLEKDTTFPYLFPFPHTISQKTVFFYEPNLYFLN